MVLHHPRADEHGQAERALEVDGENLVVQLLGHAHEVRIERGHPGVVDEHVDLAEAVVGGVDEAVELVPVADVAGDGQGLTARGRLHLLGHRLAVVELATGDDDVGARLGQAEHDGVSETAAATGDDGDLVGDVEIRHCRL